MDRQRAVAVGRELVRTVREEQVSFLAAGIAYYMFVSLLPLLLLALVVGSLVGGEAFADRVVGALGTTLTPTATDLLETALTSAAGRGGATVLGITLTLWGALKVFRGLDLAFSRIYGSDEVRTLAGQVLDALSALVGIVLALAGFGAVTAVGALFGVEVAVGGLVLIPVLAAAFLPLYYVFPDRRMRLREALPGAVFAAVGWSLLGTAFSLYAASAGTFQLYGAIGGVLLLVTWFYFAGQLLLVGAALNAALAGVPDRQLQQEPPRRFGQAMSEDAADEGAGTGTAEDLSDEELAALREEFESFREDVEGRTLHRDEVERDLRQYVRKRQRRGHARGWGPYLVLLYGTLMTLAAFYYLDGGWAVAALLVVWLSTLGLYVLMVLVGVTFTVTGLPGRVADRVRDWRR